MPDPLKSKQEEFKNAIFGVADLTMKKSNRGPRIFAKGGQLLFIEPLPQNGTIGSALQA